MEFKLDGRLGVVLMISWTVICDQIMSVVMADRKLGGSPRNVFMAGSAVRWKLRNVAYYSVRKMLVNIYGVVTK